MYKEFKSTSSLYSATCFRMADVSVQVILSSIFLDIEEVQDGHSTQS